MNSKQVTFSSVAIAVATLLSGCSTSQSMVDQSNSTISNINGTVQSVASKQLPISQYAKGTTAYSDSLSAEVKKGSVSKRASQPWVGGRMVDVQDDEVLPPIFYEANTFNFADAKGKQSRVSLRVVAERITAITGVPVRITATAPAAGTAQQISYVPPSASPLPTDMPNGTGGIDSPVVQEYVTNLDSINMHWDGNLAGFLDHVTNQLSLSWSYRSGTVMIERMLTETFSLSAFGVEQAFKMELTGGNTGNSNATGTGQSANSTLEMTERGKTDTLKALLAAIEKTVKPAGGDVVLNEATGRFYVTAPKDAMTKVRQMVNAEDESMLRQAHVQIDIYSVIRDDGDERGIDWNVAFQNLQNNWGATLSTPATLAGSLGGGLGATILQNSRGSREFAGSNAMIKMLNSMGTTVKHSPVSLIAMNRQWARKTNLKTDGYLSETTPSTSSSAGSGAPGLKTSQITTGDKFMIQPAILDNGSIMLKFGISLTELVDMFDVSTGSGDTLQKVQTPVTTGTDDQGTIKLEAGEAVLVTGLSRRLNTANKRRLADGSPLFFGGSNAVTNSREDFVIVIRAVQLK